MSDDLFINGWLCGVAFGLGGATVIRWLAHRFIHGRGK